MSVASSLSSSSSRVRATMDERSGHQASPACYSQGGTRLRPLGRDCEDRELYERGKSQEETLLRRNSYSQQTPFHLNLPVSRSSSPCTPLPSFHQAAAGFQSASSSPYQPSRFQSARSDSFSSSPAPQLSISSSSSSCLAEVVASAAERAAQAAWLAAQAASMAASIESQGMGGSQGDCGSMNNTNLPMSGDTPPARFCSTSSSSSFPHRSHQDEFFGSKPQALSHLHPGSEGAESNLSLKLYEPNPPQNPCSLVSRNTSLASASSSSGLSRGGSLQQNAGTAKAFNTFESAIVLHTEKGSTSPIISRTTSALCGPLHMADFRPRNQRVHEKRNAARISTADAAYFNPRSTKSNETTRSSSRRASGSSDDHQHAAAADASSSSSSSGGVCTALAGVGGGVYTPEIVISKSEHVIIGRSPSTSGVLDSEAPPTIIHHRSESIYSLDPSRLTSYNEGNLTDRSVAPDNTDTNNVSSVFRTLGIARQVTADSSHSRLTSQMSVGGFLENSRQILHSSPNTEPDENLNGESEYEYASSFFYNNPKKSGSAIKKPRQKQKTSGAHRPFERFSSPASMTSNSDEGGSAKNLQVLTAGVLVASPPSAENLKRLRENPQKNFNSKTFLTSGSSGIKSLFARSSSDAEKMKTSANEGPPRKGFFTRSPSSGGEQEEFFSSSSLSSASILFPKKKSKRLQKKKKSFAELAVDTARAAMSSSPSEGFCTTLRLPRKGGEREAEEEETEEETEEDSEEEYHDASLEDEKQPSSPSSSSFFTQQRGRAHLRKGGGEEEEEEDCLERKKKMAEYEEELGRHGAVLLQDEDEVEILMRRASRGASIHAPHLKKLIQKNKNSSVVFEEAKLPGSKADRQTTFPTCNEIASRTKLLVENIVRFCW